MRSSIGTLLLGFFKCNDDILKNSFLPFFTKRTVADVFFFLRPSELFWTRGFRMHPAAEENRGRRHRQMHMTRADLNLVLNNAFFTEPMTVNRSAYMFYRGRNRGNVLTVRFNLIPSFNEQWMSRNLVQVLDSHFDMQERILGSVRYDLVLRSSNADPTTYYIWRANTNQSEFDENDKVSIIYTPANIHRFCRNSSNVNIKDLNIFFSASHVTVDRCLAIVFSFVSSVGRRP